MLAWQELREWNGSQQSAFEELCCQLAVYEKAPDGSTFVRKGSPDAGVECFWKLPNGDEWGWQAKFFTSPPDGNQWAQLDKSVKTFLDKHPRIVLYTVCLPINPSDARVAGQKSVLEKWEDHVEKWQRWVQDFGLTVEFQYWGKHQIFERLSREEHRGRYLFWFGKEFFSQTWFLNRIEETIANVGPRYTPELNVELPIAKMFDGIGRSTRFFAETKSFLYKIKKEFKKAQSGEAEKVAEPEFARLRKILTFLQTHLENIDENSVNHINWEVIETLSDDLCDIVSECTVKLENSETDAKNDFEIQGTDIQYSPPKPFAYERSHLYTVRNLAYQFKNHISDNETKLTNIAALLIVGKGGTGKTHLFCDIANQRISENLPTILLLGQDFSKNEPWSQIIKTLGLSFKNKEEFLGALEAAAQARGKKGLILIDALNEGEGRSIWRRHLAGILTTLNRYPWVGIALSVRTSYEGIIIPDGLISNKLIREVHSGFAGHEYQATQTFFEYFGIERPSVPLLAPEFENPLFLKLFCLCLKKRNLTKTPSGLQGVTSIFNFFLESIDEKLSDQECLDYDKNSELVRKAVERLAQLMAEKKTKWLPRDEAQDAVNGFLPRDGYENSLFRHMISEGIVSEGRFWSGHRDEWDEGIQFSHERFTDHMIVNHLLDEHLDLENPSASFSPNLPLGALVKDENISWLNRGLIEALSIQLPERIGKELTEIVPLCCEFHPVIDAFIDSLIWRDRKAFSDATLKYINNYVIRYKASREQFLNALLTVAADPLHPYNAKFLHDHLMKSDLAERDALWSTFLHYQYGEKGAVDRIVEWAWSSEKKEHISDESIRLCGITLSWFLTTPNRYLRDRATKALVSLLENRINVLVQLLTDLLHVNDPYVLERLFAAAYGCALRSSDKEAIIKLAQHVYSCIFKDGTPPPHILLRDYARGVIETAIRIDPDFQIDVEKVKPPYKSEWSGDVPTEEELKKYKPWQAKIPDKSWGWTQLWGSVMESGDFARYIIGTNSGHFGWSSVRLNEPIPASRKRIYKNFVESLTKKQKEIFDKYETICRNLRWYRCLDDSEKKKLFERIYSNKELDSFLVNGEQAFRKTIGKKKTRDFEEHIIPYLQDPYNNEFNFNLSNAQCWIMKKVLDLGWNIELFDTFDGDVSRYAYGRSGGNAERIGKKYQWIAYHEFLARVSDNFKFKQDSWGESDEKYEGPWQLYVRDIDPSFLLKRTQRESWNEYKNTWWFPVSYEKWDSERDEALWVENSQDLPNCESLITVTNPKDSSNWLNLEAFYKWEQKTPPDEERYDVPHREIWYMLKSYIVKKSDISELFEWATQQNFMGRWMPESRGVYKVYLGEYLRATAFLYHDIPYYHHKGWTCGYQDKIPKKVLVTTDQYAQESSGYDCSLDEGISILLPCKWIADQMQLNWNGVEGHFFDQDGNLIAFDPSVDVSGPSALLMRKDKFLDFLSQNGYDILWTLIGEKRMIGGYFKGHKEPGRLQINGAFRLENFELRGKINTKYG